MYLKHLILLSIFWISGYNLAANTIDLNTVVDIPLERLKDVKSGIPGVDLFGVDYPNRLARLRLTPAQMIKLNQIGVTFNQVIISPDQTLASTGYLKPKQVLAKIKQLEESYPDLAMYTEIGRSTEDRPLGALVLTANSSENNTKPTVLFNCMHHAREVMTTEVCIDIAEELLKGYGNDQSATSWLDELEVWIVPQVNPDGNHRVHQGDLFWRKNAWKRYGGVIGVDLNRNYPEGWNSCGGSSGSFFAQNFRGPSAASEPETQAIMNLVASVKPSADISYHSFSELIIFPYGCRGRQNPARELFVSLGKQMQEGIFDDAGQSGTYRLGTAPELLYNADGTDLDYQFKEHNVLAYTIEINSRDNGFHPSYAKWRDITVERQRGGWQAMLNRVSGDAIRVRFETPAQVLYKLEKKYQGQFSAWDGGNQQKPYRTARKDGLLNIPVQPGEYRLTYYVPAQSIHKTISVAVSPNLSEWVTIKI